MVVDTYEEYPRFLERSAEDGTVSPNTEAEASVTFIQLPVLIIKEIIKLFKSIFSK